MHSNGGRKLGSPGRRTPDSADSAFCVCGQLALEPPCLPGKRYAVLQESSAPRADEHAIWDTLRSRKPGSLRRWQASSRPHARSRKGESRRTLSEPFAPFESKLMYNPPMQGIPWSTIALGSLLLISVCSIGGQEVKSPQPEKTKPPVKMEQRGRILGIGGVFFKSANRDQMREWYSKHLGLADKGQGAMLPWREHDDPQKEHVTVWTVFSRLH